MSAVRASLWGFVALLACHAAALLLASTDEQQFYTVGSAWPLRIFSPRVVLLDLGSSVYLVLGTIVVVLAVVLAVKGSLVPVILFGLSVALLLTLNATQGGLYQGIAGSVSNPPYFDQMYDDAVGLPPFPALLSHFDESATIEHWRSPHTKSHPPLPLVVLAEARRSGITPGWIAAIELLLAALAPVLALFLYRGLALPRTSAVDRTAVLLALTPAVNIYGGTSLEGVLLTLCLSVAATFVWATRRRSLWLMLASGALFAVAILTSFGALWMAAVVPFLGALTVPAYLQARRRRSLETLVFLAPSLVALSSLRLAFGYDYVAQLIHLSNSAMGVSWLSSVPLFVESRLQNVFELILLAPPLLVGAWIVAMRSRTEPAIAGRLARLLGIPLGLLLLFTPIYSEFGRGWLFLYPFLILPMHDLLVDDRDAWIVLATSGAWVLMLQSLGSFGW
ncbi:MAG: hypothetical protein M3P11_13460 [Actinomycetota bacterium]|nr:hypothetical protein [Actinomycetota bacterium]